MPSHVTGSTHAPSPPGTIDQALGAAVGRWPARTGLVDFGQAARLGRSALKAPPGDITAGFLDQAVAHEFASSAAGAVQSAAPPRLRWAI